MIYFFHGETAKAGKLMREIVEKKPFVSLVSPSAEEFLSFSPEAMLGSFGLFEKTVVLKLYGLSEEKAAKEKLLQILPELKESSSIVFIVDSGFTKTEIDKIKKVAEKSFVKAEGPKSEFRGDFKVTDALLSKDKKTFWQEIINARRVGIQAEETHGKIFWQAKILGYALKAKNAREAGVPEFSFSKAKRALPKWSEKEVLKMLTCLAQMFHRAHRGEVDLYDEMEKFALSL